MLVESRTEIAIPYSDCCMADGKWRRQEMGIMAVIHLEAQLHRTLCTGKLRVVLSEQADTNPNESQEIGLGSHKLLNDKRILS